MKMKIVSEPLLTLLLLLAVQVRIIPIVGQELFVRAFFNHFSFVQHNDIIE
jgi:hypothetical protein